MYINFRHDNKCFNLRVASVIKKDDKILLSWDGDFYTLPGGRVLFGETTEKALKRIVKEELNVEINIVKLLSINENFFDYGEDHYHELLLVYLCEVNEEIKDVNTQSKQEPYKSFSFVPYKELINVNFKPEFLLSDLDTSSDTQIITHNVSRQELD